MVYASPRQRERLEIWYDLGRMDVSSPWCVLGYFNSVLSVDEREPMGRVSVSFQEWVRDEGMIDLGFSGPRFT